MQYSGGSPVFVISTAVIKSSMEGLEESAARAHKVHDGVEQDLNRLVGPYKKNVEEREETSVFNDVIGGARRTLQVVL